MGHTLMIDLVLGGRVGVRALTPVEGFRYGEIFGPSTRCVRVVRVTPSPVTRLCACTLLWPWAHKRMR